jgi:hypothetical protein
MQKITSFKVFRAFRPYSAIIKYKSTSTKIVVLFFKLRISCDRAFD